MTSVVAGAFASHAVAANLSIKGSVNETLDASNNYFLSSNPSGTTAKSLTSGTLDFLAQTPTTRYLLDTNYSYYRYFGPGAADLPAAALWDTPFNANFSVDHVTELATYNFSASWNRVDEATALLAQTGTASGRGTINSYSAGAGVRQDLGRADTISWTGNASTVSYSDPTQTPSKDLITNVTWNHDLTQTTSFVNSVNLDWFSEDDVAKSQRLFWKLTTGVQSRLSSRLTLNADIGVGLANAWQNGTAPVVAATIPVIPLIPVIPAFAIAPPVPFQVQPGAGQSVLGDITLAYDLLKSTKVSLTAAQSIAPLITGQLQKSDSLSFNLNHNVNYYSNIALSASFTHVPASTGGSAFGNQSSDSNFFSASVSYGYQLSREWRSIASYTYLEKEGEGGAQASVILLSLTRDFTLLGNPAGINRAQEERARQRQQNAIGYVFPNFH